MLPPAMEGIVEDVVMRNINPLTHNRAYTQIGGSSSLVPDPAVLHFGGFQLGQVHRQVVRVVNKSGKGTRLHIIPPSTAFFKATCNSKRGRIAPGLDEEIEVEFCPQQHRYYYDCIRIHSEDENMLIPIHAYPILNETKFPTRVDFGVCALNDTRVKPVVIACKVPIDFEFEITWVKKNPLFSISPMRGIVPANGSITVAITFHPVTLATEECVIEVRVSEFNSVPVTCSITGSAAPGTVKDRLLKHTLGRSGSGKKSQRVNSTTMEDLDGSRALQIASLGWSTNLGGGNAKGGAGNGDAFTESVLQQRRQESSPRDCCMVGPIKSMLPKFTPGVPDVIVNGICVPDGLMLTNGDMAYVLNQEGGKLRIKEIKAAILAKKQHLAAQQSALDEVLKAGVSDGVHPLERPDYSPEVKAALFQMQLEQAAAADKKATLGSQVCVGLMLMTSQEIVDAQRLREGQHRAHQLHTELMSTTRLDAELEPCGALHLPPHSLDKRGQGEDDSSGKPPMLSPPLGSHVPEWRLLEGSNWNKRATSLTRFVNAVRRVMYNQRLSRRLARMQSVLASLGHDKTRLAEESANPVLLVHDSDRPGTAPAKHLRPDMVRTQPLPLYRECNFGYHGPVELTHYTDFDELAEQQHKVPLEFQLLGYSPEVFPGLTSYAPPLIDQPLLEGAAEEEPSLTPCGVIAAAEACPPMPDSCKQMPFVVMEVGNRYSEDKVFAAPQPSWGMDPPYQIQPRVYPLHDSTRQHSIPSGGVRALRGSPMLCETWLPRKEVWQLNSESIPALLSGPEQADILKEGVQDIDKPPIIIKAPTTEELAQFASRPETLLPVDSTSRSNTPKTGKITPPGKTPPKTPASKPGSSEVAAETVTVSVQVPQGVHRGLHVVELDKGKEASRQELVRKFDLKLDAYNAVLDKSCSFALKL